jgi:hypothetical protein
MRATAPRRDLLDGALGPTLVPDIDLHVMRRGQSLAGLTG